jgi:YfiH family protein
MLPNINNVLDYDASFTYQKNKVCVAMSADCIPILLTDKKASFVAAIHAGWRGVENNIIHKTINNIDMCGSKIIAYIAPAICKDHFEVGPEVFDIFMLQDKNYEAFFTKKNDGKFNCDLTAIAKQQLLKLGLLEQNIFLSNMCTYCNDELFFSYRRDGITGRMASLIWLT